MPLFNHDFHESDDMNEVSARSSIHGVSFPSRPTAILAAMAQSVRFSCQSPHASAIILAALASFVTFLPRNSRFRPPFLQSRLRFGYFSTPQTTANPLPRFPPWLRSLHFSNQGAPRFTQGTCGPWLRLLRSSNVPRDPEPTIGSILPMHA
jgi:hypothetical protein